MILPASWSMRASLSSGLAMRREIQFLELRAQQLSRANWPYSKQPAISDYWILEPLCSPEWNAASLAERANFSETFKQLAAAAMPWKLLAIRGAGADESDGRRPRLGSRPSS